MDKDCAFAADSASFRLHSGPLLEFGLTGFRLGLTGRFPVPLKSEWRCAPSPPEGTMEERVGEKEAISFWKLRLLHPPVLPPRLGWKLRRDHTGTK